jgi:hypothetical protein
VQRYDVKCLGRDRRYLQNALDTEEQGSNASHCSYVYRGAGKSLAQPTSRYILFDGENISFDASLVIYIYIYIYIYK